MGDCEPKRVCIGAWLGNLGQIRAKWEGWWRGSVKALDYGFWFKSVGRIRM